MSYHVLSTLSKLHKFVSVVHGGTVRYMLPIVQLVRKLAQAGGSWG